MNTTDVQGTLREMWETRPARPRQDRQVAGVASGIARRYDIDPTLVRIGFVVAAFTGIGAALYIAGWIALPDEPAHPGQPVSARSPRKIIVIGLVIAAIVSFGSLFDGDGSGGGFLSALVIAGLLFLLHRSRGQRGLATGPTTAATAGTAGVSLLKTPGEPGSDDPTQRISPPAWDPLGAAPFAWDLPEPSAPQAVAPVSRRLPVTSVTLGLALLAGAVTTGIMLLAGAFTLVNLPVLLGVMLSVIGTGLLVGAFVRTGRGLIPFALLLGILTWGAVAAPLDRWEDVEARDFRAAPTTVAALQPRYEFGAGDIGLDLRNLDLSVPAGVAGAPGDSSPVRTEISLGTGNLEVWLPADADVTFDGSVGVGHLSFGDRSEGGPGVEMQIPNDLGADGIQTGRPLVLSVENGLGNVEVHRD